MKNYYSTIDGVVLSFSDILETPDGFEYILFRFEKPIKNGFHFAEGRLPDNKISRSYGFSEDELLWQEEYLR